MRTTLLALGLLTTTLLMAIPASAERITGCVDAGGGEASSASRGVADSS